MRSAIWLQPANLQVGKQTIPKSPRASITTKGEPLQDTKHYSRSTTIGSNQLISDSLQTGFRPCFWLRYLSSPKNELHAMLDFPCILPPTKVFAQQRAGLAAKHDWQSPMQVSIMQAGRSAQNCPENPCAKSAKKRSGRLKSRGRKPDLIPQTRRSGHTMVRGTSLAKLLGAKAVKCLATMSTCLNATGCHKALRARSGL